MSSLTKKKNVVDQEGRISVIPFFSSELVLREELNPQNSFLMEIPVYLPNFRTCGLEKNVASTKSDSVLLLSLLIAIECTIASLQILKLLLLLTNVTAS